MMTGTTCMSGQGRWPALLCVIALLTGGLYLQRGGSLLRYSVVRTLPGNVTVGSTVSDQQGNLTQRNRSRILCMILTTPQNWPVKGRVVNNTWAARCDRAQFVYSRTQTAHIPDGLGLDVPEGRGHLSEKVFRMFSLLYRTHGDSYDWYLKADDDTYFIVENLRYLLSGYDPSKPHYLGRIVHNLVPRGYHSGGAGYLLSRAAVRALTQRQCAV